MNEVVTLLDDVAAYERMSKAVNPYGNGQACRRIADALAGKARIDMNTSTPYKRLHKRSASLWCDTIIRY